MTDAKLPLTSTPLPPQVSILTERLRIRTLLQDDISALHALDSDPEVKKYLAGPTKHTLEEYKSNFPTYHDPYEILVVEELQTHAFVGRVGMMKRWENLREIAVVLGPQYWDKGYGSELGVALRDFAVQNLYPVAVIGCVDPLNSKSIKMLTKLGFVRDPSINDRYHSTNVVYKYCPQS